VGCSDTKKDNHSSKQNKDESFATEERKIENFNSINIDGVFNVYLTQGNEVGLSVETNIEQEEYVISEVRENTLYLKMKDDKDFGNIDPIKIYVQVVDLKSLNTKGVGTVSCKKPLKLDQFNVICEGVGAFDLKISANKLIVNSKTVGAIVLAGKVNEVNITHKGVGILQAFDLLAQNLKLSSEGIGAAEVFASESIEINANGIGSVQYKGNPKSKKINSEGIGKVSAVD